MLHDNMQNRKRILMIGIIGILSGIFLSYVYFDDHTDEDMMRKIQNRHDYAVYMKEDSVPIELFIKPEWIPFDSDESMEINEIIETKHNTNIILQQVRNRGNDIHFSFRVTYIDLHARQGQFLHNLIFNDDGSFSSGLPNEYEFYNTNMSEIEVRSTGRGPNANFSFEIEPQDYNKIKDGFYMRYLGMKLYEYSKL